MKRPKTCFYYTTVNDIDVDVELKITYNFYAGCRGARGSFGEPLEPDDAPEIEILSAVNLENKEDLFDELSPRDIDNIEQKIFDIEGDRDYDNS